MKVIREVSIKKVSNGYILDDLALPRETRIYKDFGELITWIAFIFGEIEVGEEIELVRRKGITEEE